MAEEAVQLTSVTAGLQSLCVPTANRLIQRRGKMEGGGEFLHETEGFKCPPFAFSLRNLSAA